VRLRLAAAWGPPPADRAPLDGASVVEHREGLAVTLERCEVIPVSPGRRNITTREAPADGNPRRVGHGAGEAGAAPMPTVTAGPSPSKASASRVGLDRLVGHRS